MARVFINKSHQDETWKERFLGQCYPTPITDASGRAPPMALTKLKLERFTGFDRLVLDLSPGVNVLIGANGTGKTHLMKVAYAACDVSKTRQDFAEKLIRVFLPSGRSLGRLVKRQDRSSRGIVEVYRGERKLRASFSNHSKLAESATITGVKDWVERPVESVYIPVKEMLSNAPGFRSL
jgi:hypothetical protein